MSKIPRTVPSIVVAGGGSAGWITASVLQRMLCQGEKQAVSIRVVESARIGIIGVGEATIPCLKTLFHFLGVEEEEVIRRTQATFKHGIHYRDWAFTPEQGKRTAYFHPFDPVKVLTMNTAHWWLAWRSEMPGANYVEDLIPQYRLAAAGKAPRRPDMPEYEGVVHYAYHLDAEALAHFLAERAIEAGVERIIDDVIGTKLDQDGFLSSISTIEHGEIEADFFVDCTGFSSILLEKALGVGFDSYSDSLFCDRAMAFRIPSDGSSPLRPFTTSTAKTAGWIWDIDLQERSGVGYVYSSRHTTSEEAEKELRRHIGPKSDKLTARHLSMRIGHADALWKKNVVAIGLSGGFIEPLESTGLFFVQMGAIQLAESLIGLLGICGNTPNTAKSDLYMQSLDELSTIYNRTIIGFYEELRDFIKVHYSISKRRDSAFWRDNVDDASHPVSLTEMLSRWKTRPPQHFDFPNRMNIFCEHNWQCILLGMGWKPHNVASFRAFTSESAGERTMENMLRKASNAIANMPDHRVYFAKRG